MGQTTLVFFFSFQNVFFFFHLSFFLKEGISKPNSTRIYSLVICSGLSLMALNMVNFLIYRRAAVFLLSSTFKKYS